MDESDVVELFRDVSAYNSAFNHSPSDSMQLMGLGELPPPASCFVCNSGNCEAGYLNFGVWAEFIGNLLICAPCLIKAAEKVGCLAPSVKDLFEKSIEGLQALANEREEKLGHANERINALSTIARSALGSDGLLDTISDSISEAAAETGENVGTSPVKKRAATSNSDEHVTSEGPVQSQDFTASNSGEPIRL